MSKRKLDIIAGKGTISFIVSAESNAGIKITVTWKTGT